MGRSRTAGILVALVLAAAWIVASAITERAPSGGPALPTVGPSTAPNLASRPAPSGEIDPSSGLPTISRASLPPEAKATLDRIAAGGPFPYRADGSVYQNRERILPIRPAGTYREYTVETPGSADRGARRIVVAGSGESYWTADHYASFARILP